MYEDKASIHKNNVIDNIRTVTNQSFVYSRSSRSNLQ